MRFYCTESAISLKSLYNVLRDQMIFQSWLKFFLINYQNSLIEVLELFRQAIKIRCHFFL